MKPDPILAWYQLPEPAGTVYFERHFQDPDVIAELFSHAKVLRAVITRDGWKYLWSRFGLAGLLEINRIAGWFNPADEQTATEGLLQQSMVAGFNPQQPEELIETLP